MTTPVWQQWHCIGGCSIERLWSCYHWVLADNKLSMAAETAAMIVFVSGAMRCSAKKLATAQPTVTCCWASLLTSRRRQR